MSSPVQPVMVVGASGMLGHRVVRYLAPTRDLIAVVRPASRSERLKRILAAARVVEVAQPGPVEIATLLDRWEPRAVVNAAGLIKQRPLGADPVAMIEANALLPHRLAAECGRRGVRLIHISTDCVFSGSRGRYREDDAPDARDLYGRSKALGEPVTGGCLTLRTSMIGPEVGTAFGLLEWLRSRAGGTADGYRHVIFTGLPTVRLAALLERLLDDFPHLAGLFHVGAAPVTKYDLLGLINARYRLAIELRAVDVPVIDRSLDCCRFAAATRFQAEDWPALVELMARDEEDEQRGC